MPTYEYACTSCGHRLDAVQSFTDDPLTTCPECGGSLRKVYGAVGIVLKGSGFYKTDSRASAGSGNGSGGSGGNGAGSSDRESGDKTGGDKTSGDKPSGDKTSGDKAAAPKGESGSTGGAKEGSGKGASEAKKAPAAT
ncbi:MAG TPA: FmdB family zinc ribbon protein [Acidimicrobiales bacterium]